MVDTINKQFTRGLITEEERYNKVIEIWNSAKKQVQKELEEMVAKIKKTQFVS